MEREYQYALQLLGMTRQELIQKMSSTFSNVMNNTCLKTIIYTDGACPNNGRATQAGIGVFYGYNDSRNMSSLFNMNNPTNNRAELAAILIALENTPDHDIEICTDSKYSISCLTKWLQKWKTNQWKTASGLPVKNKEIIVNIAKYLETKNVSFRYVSNNNHIIPTPSSSPDHHGNYMADRLANNALNAS